MPECATCHEPITDIRNALMEITGWTEHRQAGGTNHVIARKRTGRLLCPSCGVDLKVGAERGQETLL